jgi:hypothetical protein
VIRYNWIESGNRELDLVDSDHAALTALASYHSTFVYGNVLIEPEGAGNSQIVHYGGDSGNTDLYRKGMLYFFQNTLVSTRSGNTTAVRLSSDGESMDARNNIFYVAADGSALGITDGAGTASLRNNWLKSGWVPTHGTLTGSVTDVSGNLVGSDPGFTDLSSQDFRLNDSSPCRGTAGPLPPEASGNQPTQQITAPGVLVARPVHNLVDIGALEHSP